MKKIYIFTNIAPHYRKSLWKLFLFNQRNEFHFFIGDYPTSAIRLINFEESELKKLRKRVKQVKNIWARGKLLIWQRGIVRVCITGRFDYAIFLGEMYCISTWVGAIICRVRGIKVAFWGHGFYGNEGKLKLILRKIFYKLAHKHLLYERRAKQLMAKEGFTPSNLYIIFNSLDYDGHKKLISKFKHLHKSEVFGFFSDPALPVLVFIGRLTTVKKLDLIIQAVNQINIKNTLVNVVVIGSGPEKGNLAKQGKEGLKKNWLHFTGSCYDENLIGKYLATADLCVSPGNVGLTAIHSLSYGTPVCTHGNMNNQMPEAEAIIEGYNGFFFEENNIKDLIDKIQKWLALNIDRILLREKCIEIIDKYYNPYYQLTVFEKLINNEKPDI